MQIKSFEELCEKKGWDPTAILPDVSKFPAKHQPALLATAKMYLVAEELNGDWAPDWNDRSEYKWLPWFDMEVDGNNPSGFRFGAASYGIPGTYSTGGSRLCYRSEKLAKYAGETFIDLYRDMMVIPK